MAAYGSSNSATGTGSAVVTKPTGLAAGDLMVAFVVDRGSDYESGSPSTPSGWTSMTSGETTIQGIWCFAKIADSGDAGATNFTFSHSNGSAKISALMYRITGTFAAVNNIYAIAVNAGSESSSGVFDFANGITPSVASSLLIMATIGYSATNDFDSSSTGSYALETSNPSWTQRLDANYYTSDVRHRLSSATATRTEVTATGYYRVTYTIAGSEDPSQATGILIAIADTQNATPTLDVVSLVGNVQAPSVAGNAVVPTLDVVSVTSAVQAPTIATDAPTVMNVDKPSPGAISNIDKP